MSSQNSRTDTCNTHGRFESLNIFGSIWSRCPACTEEAEARQRAEQELADKHHRQNVWQSTINESGIPFRFQDRTLAMYEAINDGQHRALTFAKEYADGFSEVRETGRCAIFVGRPGTGKTHLACGIMLQVMEAGYSAYYATVRGALRRVKDTWRRDANETEGEAVAAFVRPDLLVLDEVGVQFGSETEQLILFDILNARYERRLPTLLLSNLTPDNVKACLGERISDRMREDGGVTVPFDWTSHRGK